MENGVEIINNGIKLISENKYSLDRTDCHNCYEKDDLICLGSIDNYKYYECSKCKSKIKVNSFKEIVNYKFKL